MSDSQRFIRYGDGSYEVKVKRLSFGMTSSISGLKSDWQTEDCIYGASLSNMNAIVETKLVEAVAEGVTRGLTR